MILRRLEVTMVLLYYIFGFIVVRVVSYGKLWFEVVKKEKQDYGKTILKHFD